jgi:hypothetical protein
MPPLSQLPSLKYLSLELLEAMEYITTSNEFSSSSSAPIPFFPSLKEIKLRNCFNLKGWWMRGRHSSVEVNSDGDNSVEITAVTSMTEHCLLPLFPCLSTLEIVSSPKLTSMPMFPHLERQVGPEEYELEATATDNDDEYGSTTKPNTNHNRLLFIHSSLKIEAHRIGFHCGSRNSARGVVEEPHFSRVFEDILLP